MCVPCGAVFAIAWRTGCKSLLFRQLSTDSSLVCMRMAYGALSLPSHGEQEVSLCSSLRAALIAHSCVCAWRVALSLPSHGEQEVSLCSSRSAGAHSCVCALHAALSLPLHGRTGCKSLPFQQRSTHGSLVYMCMTCGAVSAIAW
jgi:hypothetical protein